MESNWLCLVLVVLWSTTHLSTAARCTDCEYVEVKDTAYLHLLMGRYEIMPVGCDSFSRNAYRQDGGRNYLFYQDSTGAGSFEGWVIGANLCNFSTVEMRVSDTAQTPGAVTEKWKEYYLDEWRSSNARVPCEHVEHCADCEHVDVKDTAYLHHLEGRYEITTEVCHGRGVYRQAEGNGANYIYFMQDFKGWVIATYSCYDRSAEMRVYDQALSPGHVVGRWEEFYGNQWWSTNARVLCKDELSAGEIAGIVIGVIAAVALIGGGIAFYFYKKKMKRGAVGGTEPGVRTVSGRPGASNPGNPPDYDVLYTQKRGFAYPPNAITPVDY